MVRPPPGNAGVHLYQKDGTKLFSMRVPLSYSCPMETVRIGYARCSTDRQDLTAQRSALVDLDHGKLELLIRPVRGFKTVKTAYATIKGFEVMRALRKGQAGIFALQDGIVGEARIVERAFGLGPCALTEVMALLQERLTNAEA